MTPTRIKEHIGRIETALDATVSTRTHIPEPLVSAMRHSLLAGGKRLRPVLLLTACEAFGGDSQAALPYALAMEMIHTYSLIHDDLPAMDDDDLRRGRPTCHVVYGEGMAVLAGDGLLSCAFETMAAAAAKAGDADRLNHVLAMGHIASGCGVTGMVAGQCVDLDSENKHVNEATLRYVHEKKTAALLRASVMAGAQLAGVDSDTLWKLSEFARHLGLWFQMNDDILDVEADPAVIGKPVGSDARQEKATFIQMFGLDTAKALREQELARARRHLDAISGNNVAQLKEMLDWLCAIA